MQSLPIASLQVGMRFDASQILDFAVENGNKVPLQIRHLADNEWATVEDEVYGNQDGTVTVETNIGVFDVAPDLMVTVRPDRARVQRVEVSA